MDEKEELVKKALFSFVRKQVPTAQLRYEPVLLSCLKNSRLPSADTTVECISLGRRT